MRTERRLKLTKGEEKGANHVSAMNAKNITSWLHKIQIEGTLDLQVCEMFFGNKEHGTLFSDSRKEASYDHYRVGIDGATKDRPYIIAVAITDKESILDIGD